jgi:hypothetical protein
MEFLFFFNLSAFLYNMARRRILDDGGGGGAIMAALNVSNENVICKF